MKLKTFCRIPLALLFFSFGTAAGSATNGANYAVLFALDKHYNGEKDIGELADEEYFSRLPDLQEISELFKRCGLNVFRGNGERRNIGSKYQRC